MAVALIGLGSNLGDRHTHLQEALDRLRRLTATELIRISRFHETDPVGGPSQGKFLNAAAHLETGLEPLPLLHRLLEIEQALGRPPGHARWHPRTIDLDLLDYDQQILETSSLTLPHPRLHERGFVLQPLSEIAPGWRHPVLGKSVRELLQAVCP